jgi:hypothetical protein
VVAAVALAAVIFNPLGLAKVRTQTAGGATVHHQCDTGMSVFRSVVRGHGIRGLVVAVLGTATLMPTTTKLREVLRDAGRCEFWIQTRFNLVLWGISGTNAGHMPNRCHSNPHMQPAT